VNKACRLLSPEQGNALLTATSRILAWSLYSNDHWQPSRLQPSAAHLAAWSLKLCWQLSENGPVSYQWKPWLLDDVLPARLCH
jgi:hypothetical protein